MFKFLIQNRVANYLKPLICITLLFGSFLFSTARRGELRVASQEQSEPFVDKGVHIWARAYSSYESQRNLEKNILALGVQPIEVKIQNHSDKTYYLSTDGIDIESLSPKKVAGTLLIEAIPRSIAYKVVSFFFWPMILPATIDEIITYTSYRSLKGDLEAKSVKNEGEAILPYSTVHRILFVSNSQMREELDVTLFEAEENRSASYLVRIG